MSEATLVTALRLRLEAAGAYVEKNHGSSVETAGRPDLSGCYRGYYFGFEIKLPKGKTTRVQEYVLGWIRRAGGYAGVIRSTAQLDDILRRWPLVCKQCLGRLRGADDEDGGMVCADCGWRWT